MEIAAKKKKKSLKLLLILAIVVVVLGVAVYFLFLRGKDNENKAGEALAASYTTQAVERGDITSSITGSGTLEAADNYTVTSLREGNILSASFEEGDQVTEGQILYEIDSSDASSSVEQAEISYRQSQNNYNKKVKNREDLKVYAQGSGRITELDVEVGDEITAKQNLGTIQDTDHITLKVPFLKADAMKLSAGQTATVTMDSTFETITGTVKEVSTLDSVGTGNSVVRMVEISVTNPGGITESSKASASVGSLSSAGAGTFCANEQYTISADINGTVVAIHGKKGDLVKEDALILTLSSDDLEDEITSAKDNLRNAEISLENRYDTLDDYTIEAPISGTVVEKNYKTGESYEQNKTLCIIYDLSYLTMTLSVDELDISNIEVGQDVEITADAVEGKTYEGVVTKVSIVGSSSNGVTTYPVTIRLDEFEGLRPGMTVDATIVLQSSENVLIIPSAALQRGDQVLVTADSPSAANGEAVEGTEYFRVEVTVGNADDDNTEIVSGLQEGDTIAYIARSGEDTMFPGMGMGMNMGGMGGMGGGPSGGGPGGRP